MFTRGYERTRGTPSYRQALLSAMRVYLAVPLFRPGGGGNGPKRPGAVRWSLEHLVYQALLMVYASEATLKDGFNNARQCLIEMSPSRRRPGKTYQGFIKAQSRWGPEVADRVQAHLRTQHRRVADAFWERFGWVPLACDGSRVEVPRTARNKSALGRAGRRKTGPQLFVTTLYHMGTGLPWDWRIGKGTGG